MFNWFSRKKEIAQVKEDTKNSFDLVKRDIDSVGEWIKHLNSTKDVHKKDIDELKDILSTVKKDVDEIKNIVFMAENLSLNKLIQTPKQLFRKQTAVVPVQTAVQTGIQTPFFSQFSSSEKSTLWILLNTDMKLSYEDMAVVLGKEKATIRGQINSIKQKSEGIIKEVIENNGKKRLYIPDEIKEKLIKKQKVRVKKKKKVSDY